jgi:phosphohistidine phosphatase
MDTTSRLVVLVRHAKAESGEEGSDHDRRLTSRGERDAADTGRWLASAVPRVDHVWVSSAVRAVQTWEAVRRSLPEPGEVVVDRALYQAGTREVVDHVTGRSDPVQLLVGHNPTFEQAVMALTGDLHGLRPSAAAVIELAGDRGRLVDLWQPQR